jgi:hypothetical protein
VIDSVSARRSETETLDELESIQQRICFLHCCQMRRYGDAHGGGRDRRCRYVRPRLDVASAERAA